MKYLIPSLLEYPRYEWKRYDFSFDFDVLWEYKASESWMCFYGNLKLEEYTKEDNYTTYFIYEWRQYTWVISDDDFSWLGYWGLTRWDIECLYVWEVVNDWAHWRGSALFANGDRFDGERRNWERNGWWILRSKTWEYREWIRKDNVLVDKCFYIFDEKCDDEAHTISVDWNILYWNDSIDWSSKLKIYEYKIKENKIYLRQWDAIILEGKDWFGEDYVNNEYSSEWKEMRWFLPVQIYILVRNKSLKEMYRYADSIIQGLKNLHQDISHLCMEYWITWKNSHFLNDYGEDFENEGCGYDEYFEWKDEYFHKKNILLQKDGFNKTEASRWLDYALQIQEILKSWNLMTEH